MDIDNKSNKSTAPPNEIGSNRNNKGQFISGNTASVGKGRPKNTQSIPDMLQKIGEEYADNEESTKLDVVLRKVFKYATQGKSWAVQFIADRTEGKAIERVQKQNIEAIKVIDIEGVKDDR